MAEVRYENLRVEVSTDAGDRALPSVLGAYLSSFKVS